MIAASPQQLPIFGGGAEARDAGLALVALNGEEFLRHVRKAAELIAARHGSVTADDLRAWCSVAQIRPHHPNLWGAVFKAPGWRCIDRRRSTLRSNHAREIRVWAYEPPPAKE